MCINIEICKPIRNFWPFFQTRKLNWATIIISPGHLPFLGTFMLEDFSGKILFQNCFDIENKN